MDRSRWPLNLGRAGAVAIVTAVCLPALVMIMGFVADFAYASYINQTLARATDNATVGSVSQTAATAGGGYGDIAYMQNYGVNMFNANVSKLPFTGINFNLAVASDGTGGVTATGTYSFNVPTFFGRMLGITTIPVSGTAATSARPLVYVNYYIIVDTSQSMGIASTPAAMTQLYNLVVANKNGSYGGVVELGCVFGCHVIGSDQIYAKVTNEVLAHTNGVELRIDAAVNAVKSIITQAQSIAATAQNIKFGLYTMQQDPTANPLLPGYLVTTVQSPSSNYSSLLASASTIDLGNNTAAGTGDSNFPSELAAFNNILTTNGVITNGTGASAISPLNYFLIVTDGLADVSPSGPSSHRTNAFDPAGCTPLKSKGTVGVVYTTYNPIYYPNGSQTLEFNYNSLVAPASISGQIVPNLQSCVSSSNFYFEASDGPDIVTAMQTLFQQTQAASARITQ